MKLIDRLLGLVYPNRCVACGKLLKAPALCSDCRQDVRLIKRGSCPRCGGVRGKCDCDTRNLAFDGFTAPFAYDGAVRWGLLNMKFYRRPDAAQYFGWVLAEKISREYAGIKFDGVCFVPMSDSGLKERGYNQAALLAGRVSELLDIPLIPNALYKVGDTSVQHRLGMAQRFENVKGAYLAGIGVENKCILLIDDIRTTGATLHECAKVLKKSGARSVFCAVVASASSADLC